MNKDIEFEKASKEAHYKWSSELAKRNLGQEISPAEISSLGRVPWEAAVSWAYEWCMRKNIIVRQMLITYGDVETLMLRAQLLNDAQPIIRALIVAFEDAIEEDDAAIKSEIRSNVLTNAKEFLKKARANE